MPSYWRHRPLAWPPGAESPGTWQRRALRDEPLSSGPSGRLRCGRGGRPTSPILRPPTSAQAEAVGRLRWARLEAEDELRWEVARAAGGTQAEVKTAEATAAVSAAAAAAASAAAAEAEAEAWVAPEIYTRDSAEALEHARRKARTYLLTTSPLAYVLTWYQVSVPPRYVKMRRARAEEGAHVLTYLLTTSPLAYVFTWKVRTQRRRTHLDEQARKAEARAASRRAVEQADGSR